MAMEENHFPEADEILSRFHEADDDTHHGHKKNADGVVDVVLKDPEPNGEDLKHKKWMQNLFEEEMQIALHFYIDCIQSVECRRNFAICSVVLSATREIVIEFKGHLFIETNEELEGTVLVVVDVSQMAMFKMAS
jgi:hypothetical protein